VKKIILILIGVLSFLFAVTLYLKNPHNIEVSYYFGLNYQFNVAILLILTFVLGIVFGLIVMTLSLFKEKMRFSAEHRKLVKVEKEVENLRAMPLKDEV